MFKRRKHSDDRSAQGADNDELRRTGIRRFADVLSWNFSKLLAVNLFFLVCAAPTAVLFLLALSGALPGYAFALSVVAACPTGGAVSACMFCISKMLYGEPGFLWGDLKRKFLENVKQAALPGILSAAFLYGQVFFWGMLAFKSESTSVVWLIIGVLTLLLFILISPFVFLQFAYVELKTMQICTNSALLAFAHLPRSFAGAVLGNIIWIAFLLYLPASLLATPLLALFGFSLSWLLWLMWAWSPFDKQFSIEETLRKRSGGIR